LYFYCVTLTSYSHSRKGSSIQDVHVEGQGAWPNVNKGGQGDGGRFLLYFCGHPLRMTPNDPSSAGLSNTHQDSA